MTQKINITEQIKSFEDAMAATGRPNVPDLSNFPEDMREYFAAHYKLAVIAEAINDGWKANYTDGNQKKWFPWLYCAPGSSSFAFLGSYYYCSYARAGDASRLCFKSKTKAEYAGRQFIDLWNIILLK